MEYKFLLAVAFAVLALASAEVDFTGRYKMTVSDSDNYNELLKALDIGYFKRLAATSSSSEYDISQDKAAGTYTLRTITTFKDGSITFTPGVEFKESRADGNDVKSVVTINGNKWTQVQKVDDSSPELTIERTFNGKVIDVITKYKGVTVTRKYEKQ